MIITETLPTLTLTTTGNTITKDIKVHLKRIEAFADRVVVKVVTEMADTKMGTEMAKDTAADMEMAINNKNSVTVYI